MTPRLEELNRIYEFLLHRFDEPKGELDQQFVDDYHKLLDRLSEVAGDAEDFRIRKEDMYPGRMRTDYGGMTVHYSGPLRGDEPLVLSRHLFRQRCHSAMSYTWRLIKQEEQLMATSQRSPGDVLDERSRLLATILDVYLQSPEEILIHHIGDDKIGYFHPNWPRGYVPDISHVKALATSNQIDLEQRAKGDWSINLPNKTLQEFAARDGEAVQNGTGEQRIEALMGGVTINQHIYGGSHNIANASSRFEQTITVGATNEDIVKLLNALKALGISETIVDDLEQEIARDSNPRQAVMRWLFNVGTDITSGALGSLAAANYASIAALITAFASGVIG